ncbi:MAG: hypothetical protein K2W82_04825 [Candidatus Obscuribacterales bacterium]|nr:hypothetical protein [Candidatus Obscuribacterales bacterium]
MTDTSNPLEQAELSLREAESLLGSDNPHLADKLDDYARLLRQDGSRLLEAVNIEARAEAIRKKHGLPSKKSQHINHNRQSVIPDELKDIFASVIEDMHKWCQGRYWLPRLLLLLWMVQICISSLQDPMYQSIFKGLDLGIHEMGHMVFNPFGEFMSIAGGSLLQCLVPVISMVMFFRQRDYFAIAFAWGWLAINLFDVATYAADARAMELPLVSPFAGGEEPIHDWNYLLSSMHMLNLDTTVATLLRTFAAFSMLICMLFGSWLLLEMGTKSKTKLKPHS